MRRITAYAIIGIAAGVLIVVLVGLSRTVIDFAASPAFGQRRSSIEGMLLLIGGLAVMGSGAYLATSQSIPAATALLASGLTTAGLALYLNALLYSRWTLDTNPPTERLTGILLLGVGVSILGGLARRRISRNVLPAPE